jgi:hypothetical protein
LFWVLKKLRKTIPHQRSETILKENICNMIAENSSNIIILAAELYQIQIDENNTKDFNPGYYNNCHDE